MTEALELVGLAALAVGAFLLAVPVGFLAVGGCCLFLSWARTKR
jgi:hypothetical protein